MKSPVLQNGTWYDTGRYCHDVLRHAAAGQRGFTVTTAANHSRADRRPFYLALDVGRCVNATEIQLLPGLNGCFGHWERNIRNASVWLTKPLLAYDFHTTGYSDISDLPASNGFIFSAFFQEIRFGSWDADIAIVQDRVLYYRLLLYSIYLLFIIWQFVRDNALLKRKKELSRR